MANSPLLQTLTSTWKLFLEHSPLLRETRLTKCTVKTKPILVPHSPHSTTCWNELWNQVEYFRLWDCGGRLEGPVNIRTVTESHLTSSCFSCLVEDCNDLSLTNGIVSLLFRKTFLKSEKKYLKYDCTRMLELTVSLGLANFYSWCPRTWDLQEVSQKMTSYLGLIFSTKCSGKNPGLQTWNSEKELLLSVDFENCHLFLPKMIR